MIFAFSVCLYLNFRRIKIVMSYGAKNDDVKCAKLKINPTKPPRSRQQMSVEELQYLHYRAQKNLMIILKGKQKNPLGLDRYTH